MSLPVEGSDRDGCPVVLCAATECGDASQPCLLRLSHQAWAEGWGRLRPACLLCACWPATSAGTCPEMPAVAQAGTAAAHLTNDCMKHRPSKVLLLCVQTRVRQN